MFVLPQCYANWKSLPIAINSFAADFPHIQQLFFCSGGSLASSNTCLSLDAMRQGGDFPKAGSFVHVVEQAVVCQYDLDQAVHYSPYILVLLHSLSFCIFSFPFPFPFPLRFSVSSRSFSSSPFHPVAVRGAPDAYKYQSRHDLVRLLKLKAARARNEEDKPVNPCEKTLGSFRVSFSHFISRCQPLGDHLFHEVWRRGCHVDLWLLLFHGSLHAPWTTLPCYRN